MYEVLFSVKVTAALTIDINVIPINKRYFKTSIFFPSFYLIKKKFILAKQFFKEKKKLNLFI